MRCLGFVRCLQSKSAVYYLDLYARHKRQDYVTLIHGSPDTWANSELQIVPGDGAGLCGAIATIT
jgi:hypothetical protein